MSAALAELAAHLPRPAHARRDLDEVRRVTTLLDVLHALNAGLAEDMRIHAQLAPISSDDRTRLAQLATVTCETAEAANALTQAAHLAVQSALGHDRPGAARAYTAAYDGHLRTAQERLRNASLFGRSRTRSTVPATVTATATRAAARNR